MKKKLGLIFALLIIGTIAWYLFIWPSDFLVTFKTKAIPGTVNQTIKLWANGLENSHLLHQKDVTNFTHQMQFNDSLHNYQWNIKSLNDSTSQVKVYVKDVNNSLTNRISIIFKETDFEKRTKKTLKDLMLAIKEHTENFKVSLVGIDEIAPKYCAYLSFKSHQKDKALHMMQNYSFLNSVIIENNIELDGPPFIEVENWNMQQDTVTFNFCYPIVKPDSLIKIKHLKYKPIARKKAIKSVYNGNYITSDRAWYALIDYAKKEGLNIEEKPFEIFYTNPNMGGNELQWKAEVYMPLKD